MPPFPTATLGRDYVKTRFLEPSLPEAMDQRHRGMPRGVYLGYSPYAAPGSNVLQLLSDPFHGFSMLKVGGDGVAQIDIFTNQTITLDFTGHTFWPIYVLATSNYAAGRTTSAKIFTRATKAVGLNEVLICKVNRSGSDLVIEIDVPTNRQPPLAFAGQRFGFMGLGSIANLSTAVSIGAEVVTARTSLYTGVHASLKSRIDDDVSGSSLATRLGLTLQHIVGNAYSGVTGASWNVSGSFAETNRQFNPKITFEANGTETQSGVITAPSDAVRNVAFLIDDLTGNRIVDETSPSTATPTLNPIYGRLSYLTGSNGIGKQIYYVSASDNVTGVGNPFSVLQQGDIVQAPPKPPAVVGKFYELKTIIDGNTAVLGAAFDGNNGFVDNSTWRRFTLSFFNLSGAYTIPTAKTIRLSFPVFVRLDQSVFDGLLYMRKTAELPGVPSATTTVAGKVLQATAGANAGTVSAENTTAPVGSNFHTLNFTLGGATNAGAGVANVSVPGVTGPAGANSAVGPRGPTGSAGAGYLLSIPFKRGPTVTAPFVGSSWTYDFAADGFVSIAALTGGFAQITLAQGNGNYFQIDSFTPASPSATEGTIVMSSNFGGATYALFLGACS